MMMKRPKSQGTGKRVAIFFSRLALQYTSIAIVFLLMASSGGCTSTARELAGAAAPAAVHSSLSELNAAEDQRQLQLLADSPAFQHAGQKIGESVSVGLLNEANILANGDIVGPDRNSAGPSTSPASNIAATHPVSGLMGQLNGFVKSSVQEAFLAATDPQFKAGEEALSEAIGEGFVTGMITVLKKKGPEIGETVRIQLGPIVQQLIREQIAPAVRDMVQQQLAPAALQVWREGAVDTLKLSVRPDLQPDVQQNAQNVSVGAGHGTHQMMVESGVITSAGDLTPHWKLGVWLVASAAALLFIAFFSLLVVLNLLVIHHWRRRHAVR
jgi:hypothetical protein